MSHDDNLHNEFSAMSKQSGTSALEMSNFGRLFKRLFFYIGSTNVRLNEIKRRRQYVKTIETFKVEYMKADEYNHEQHKVIFNVGLYLLIIENDISALKFLIFNEIDDWPKKLVARKFVILLYESSKDLSKLLGNDLRKIINSLPEKESLSDELNDIMSDLNKFKNKNSAYLSLIRNNCSAHRDNKAIIQLNSIDEIDIHRLHQEIGAEFMVPIRKLNTSFMSNLLKAMINKHKRDLADALGKRSF